MLMHACMHLCLEGRASRSAPPPTSAEGLTCMHMRVPYACVRVCYMHAYACGDCMHTHMHAWTHIRHAGWPHLAAAAASPLGCISSGGVMSRCTALVASARKAHMHAYVHACVRSVSMCICVYVYMWARLITKHVLSRQHRCMLDIRASVVLIGSCLYACKCAMYACMYVCVRVSMCACVRACVCVHACACVCMYVSTPPAPLWC